ncbi:HAMP domain-containing sensor histidine kinase [Paenibacillus sp. 481]|uniref:HAMP domain-containing sensor histidine kinase n=1 Tax=Paenibacillus sp. 481 TaxID=2835869 RepID=UPI001E59168B|nr:sensor histidine kinase [Paenibacillus sp. 481]UHA72348.1 sensor histidine kinase [Paenibacillus sp. 481]
MITRWIRSTDSTKWELLLSFIVVGCLTIIGLWFALDNVLVDDNWWMYVVVLILSIALIAGYVTGLRIQRRLDVLQEHMMQVTKGNWSVRIPVQDSNGFSPLYEDFNNMINEIEPKLHLLQKLSEQDVMERDQEREAVIVEERRRLARDLHDTVSQQLFALHMASSSLPKVMDLDEQRARILVEQLIQMSHTAQRQMRVLIAQLRPLELNGHTLQEALQQWFPDYCRQNGLQGKIEVDVRTNLSEAKEYQCFLMIQEAMANVVKHARARQVTLTLHETQRQVVLVVADDGIGFDLQSARGTGSYGLLTMRERVDKLGGHLDLISQSGAGTTIRAYIPLFEEIALVEDTELGMDSD